MQRAILHKVTGISMIFGLGSPPASNFMFFSVLVLPLSKITDCDLIKYSSAVHYTHCSNQNEMKRVSFYKVTVILMIFGIGLPTASDFRFF